MAATRTIVINRAGTGSGAQAGIASIVRAASAVIGVLTYGALVILLLLASLGVGAAASEGGTALRPTSAPASAEAKVIVEPAAASGPSRPLPGFAP